VKKTVGENELSDRGRRTTAASVDLVVLILAIVCPCNGFETRQRMTFWPRKGYVAHHRVFGLGTNAKKIAA